MPTALDPSASGFTQISIGPSALTRSPWIPARVLIYRDHITICKQGNGLRRHGEEIIPASSGAARIAHKLM